MVHALKMSVSIFTCGKYILLHSNKPLYRRYFVLRVIFLNRNRITQPSASASVHFFSTYFADISWPLHIENFVVYAPNSRRKLREY